VLKATDPAVAVSRIAGRPYLDRFRHLVAAHDPEGKFVNEFTRRLFTSEAGQADEKRIEQAA
jgi:hypothetical protein